jgi:CheY-like chemotaxis protein
MKLIIVNNVANFGLLSMLSKPGPQSQRTVAQAASPPLGVTLSLKFTQMNKRGPIIIIEDDKDDQDVLAEIFEELNYNNKLIFFGDSVEALEYLTNTDIEPFLVLSDINMPKLNGMELREKIHNNEDLRLKSIPYLFFSTSAEQKHVIDAYSRSIQGFFVKANDYDKLKSTIIKIVEYWQECESPNYIKNAQ